MKEDQEPSGEAPPGREDAPPDGELVLDALLRWGFIKSYGEGRRFIANGAVAIDGSQVFDGQARITAETKTIRFGKRVFDILTEEKMEQKAESPKGSPEPKAEGSDYTNYPVTPTPSGKPSPAVEALELADLLEATQKRKERSPGCAPSEDPFRDAVHKAITFLRAPSPLASSPAPSETPSSLLQSLVAEKNKLNGVILQLIDGLRQIEEKGDQESRRLARHAMRPWEPGKEMNDAPAEGAAPTQGGAQAVDLEAIEEWFRHCQASSPNSLSCSYALSLISEVRRLRGQGNPQGTEEGEVRYEHLVHDDEMWASDEIEYEPGKWGMLGPKWMGEKWKEGMKRVRRKVVESSLSPGQGNGLDVEGGT